MMLSITNGVTLALDVCRKQFKNEAWNCSSATRGQPTTAASRPHRDVHGRMRGSVFRHAPRLGTRESAFVHAIASAGVVTTVTKDCRLGLIENCGCDLSWPKSHSLQSPDFEWGGCSANVAWGREMSRLFVDAGERTDGAVGSAAGSGGGGGRFSGRGKRIRQRKRATNEMRVNLKNNEIGRQVGSRCCCRGRFCCCCCCCCRCS